MNATLPRSNSPSASPTRAAARPIPDVRTPPANATPPRHPGQTITNSSKPLPASGSAPKPPATQSRPAAPAGPKSSVPRPPSGPRANGSRTAPEPARSPDAERPDHTILFQSFFKSVGPRTYVAQLKRATNDNHYLVLTEGRRDKESGEVRKHRINIFSEDFDAFFNLLRDAARFIKEHPLPADFVAKRKAFWNKTKRPRGPRRTAARIGASGASPA